MSASEQASEAEIWQRWPLHVLVWKDDPKALEALIQEKQFDCEQLDPRGRTPLHLAVSLGRVRCAEILLCHGANALAVNRHQWSALNEAVCGGNPELIGLLLRHRDQQQAKARAQDIPLLLERLQSTQDYYIEMKWEFSSWIPFISRMCPSDTYKIWKKGTSVRVDTTLIGFDHFSWQRGNLSFIFKGMASGAHVSEISHDRKIVWEEEFKLVEQDPVQTLIAQEMAVVHRLNSPVVSTFLDTDSVSFHRQKSGIWGFRSDRVENISGYDTKVFSASGLDIVTKTRVEHLPEAEKHKHKSVNPLQDFLGGGQDGIPALDHAANIGGQPPPAEVTDSAPRLSMEEYFHPAEDPKEYDAIGRPVELSSRVQKLKATVWLGEGFPLSLQEQIMPIIELMALNNAHFAKLKDFITLQMPAGFPIKFEIPLFHVMSAKVTFGNFNGHSQPAPHVSLHTKAVRVEPVPVPTPSPSVEVGGIKRRHPQATLGEGGSTDHPTTPQSGTVEQEVCTISEECFTVPSLYRRLSRGRGGIVDEEEQLLQLAIRQSLLDQGGGGEGDGGGGEGNREGSGGRDGEELSLTEALKDEGLLTTGNSRHQNAVLGGSQTPLSAYQLGMVRGGEEDTELELALALSRQQADKEEQRRRQQEEEELELVLRLSLEDK